VVPQLQPFDADVAVGDQEHVNDESKRPQAVEAAGDDSGIIPIPI